MLNSHVAEVRRLVPPEKLLVFDMREGWPPFCRFLNKPVPDMAFPKVNDAAMMLFTFNIIRSVYWFVLLALSLGLAVLVPRCETVSGILVCVAWLIAIIPFSGRLLLAVTREHARRKT